MPKETIQSVLAAVATGNFLDDMDFFALRAANF